MIKSKLLAAAMLCALCGSLATAQEAEEPQAGAGARVRFFGQAAIGIKFFKNQSCYAGRGIQASKKNLGGVFAKNISIGMPNSPTVDSIKSRDGILFSATYHEFAVRADEPLTILVDYSETTGGSPYFINDTGRGGRCDLFAGTFKPEVGRDYDITVDIGGGACQLKVQRIELKDGGAELQPVQVDRANKCTSADVLPIAVCKSTFAQCKADAIEKFKEISPNSKPDKTVFAECSAEYKACVAETK